MLVSEVDGNWGVELKPEELICDLREYNSYGLFGPSQNMQKDFLVKLPGG